MTSDCASSITKKSKTLIDFVISNNYTIKAEVLLVVKISDHCTIEIVIPDIRPNLHNGTKMTNYSKDAICNELNKVNWSVASNYGMNDKAKFLINNIKKSVSKFIKETRVKDCDNKWYNEQLAALRNKRDTEHTVAVITDDWLYWMEFSATNKLYRQNIKATNSYYIKNKLKAADGDQKKMCKALKEILNGNGDDLPDFVEFNGIVKTDKDTVAI